MMIMMTTGMPHGRGCRMTLLVEATFFSLIR